MEQHCPQKSDVTTAGSEGFVPVAERIAVFDNDGTLWCENPLPSQLGFAAAEVHRLMPEHPEWESDPAIQAFIKGDVAALKADHAKGLLEILAKTHANQSPEDFNTSVSNWLASAKHPRFGSSYDRTTYQPMLELLVYLRDKGFQTWIVSGGGQDFMRVFADKTYGIVPQQVIGSQTALKYETEDGKPTLTKTMDTVFVDNREGKPEAIHRFIGRRPIAAFGNSDGDQAMVEYTTLGNPLPSFGLMVHHTDAEREYAYDADPKSNGKLVTALASATQNGWTVVDTKTDWSAVFPGDG